MTAVRPGSGDRVRVRAHYVIGCDGGRSAVRDLAGITMVGDTVAGERHLAGDVDVHGLDRSHAWAWYDGIRMAGLTPLPGRAAWQFQANLFAGLGGAFPEPTLELFQQLLVERSGRRDIVLSDLTWASDYRIHHRVADHYRAGRVFVAGDAAHLHSPAGGQGANASIQDAYNLGWKLAAAVRGYAAPGLLDTYEQERRPVAEGIMKLNRAASTALAGSGASSAWLRRNVIWRLSSLPGGAEVMLRKTDQLAISYRGGPLSMDAGRRARAGARAGDRAPGARLVDPGTGASMLLHDVFRGPQFTLLCFGLPPGAVRGLAAGLDPELVGTCTILPPDRPAGGYPGRVLIDPRGQAARDYHGGAGALVLVRPDGYLGLHAPAAEAAARLAEYLRRIIAPAPRAAALARAGRA